MLRFDFSGSRRHGVRGKPFKLFSDELPIIDFEQQHLLQRLAEQDFTKGSEYLKKKKKGEQEQDSHSLPTIGGPDWDLLSGSDRQSIKSDSRLHPLKPDLPHIHRKIRERLGFKDKQDESSPNYFHRSIHRSENAKSMPKPDEYKKFVQWPRLPSQQIVNQADMQQNLLDLKDDVEYKPTVPVRKVNKVNNIERHTKYRLKLDHATLDLPNVRLNGRQKNKKDVETQTPRDLSNSNQEVLNYDETCSNKNAKGVVDTDAAKPSIQAVSILKKSTNQDAGAKSFEIIFSPVQSRPAEQDNEIMNALVHCDIPRRQLKKTVFNTYVGDVINSDIKGSKKVNFIDDHGSDKLSHLRVDTNNENVEEKMSTNQDTRQPKLVSSYSFQRKDLEQIARKHLLRDHTTKTQRLQNMMKHFRKIRGRQNMPKTVNLSVKTQADERPHQIKDVKDTGHSSLSSHSESTTPSSVTPRNKVDVSKHEPQLTKPRLDMSKSETLNEDIETCIQIRKSHKNVKRHRITKHAKTEEQNVVEETNNKDVDPENEIDRSLSGPELIKFYRLWNRKRHKHPSGRTIDEPPTVTDYFSNVSHKKLNRMSMIAESDGVVAENG